MKILTILTMSKDRFCLSVYLCIYLSTYLFIIYLPTYLYQISISWKVSELQMVRETHRPLRIIQCR